MVLELELVDLRPGCAEPVRYGLAKRSVVGPLCGRARDASRDHHRQPSVGPWFLPEHLST